MSTSEAGRGERVGPSVRASPVHPLLSLTGSLLVNLGDCSVLLLPHGDWSLSDNVALAFGGTFGIGPGLRSDRTPGSEYGPAPRTLYAAIKAYF